MMKVIQIDLSSPVAAYEQIASSLRSLLVSRQFRSGDQLPTVRQLALDLGVHHNTVAEAYRELAAEGWLDLRRGRGAVVRARISPPPAPAALKGFAKRLEELLAKGITEGIPHHALARELRRCAAEVEEGASK